MVRVQQKPKEIHRGYNTITITITITVTLTITITIIITLTDSSTTLGIPSETIVYCYTLFLCHLGCEI